MKVEDDMATVNARNTLHAQKLAQDRADFAPREGTERGDKWSLGRCRYPAFCRAYCEFYGRALCIDDYLTDDAADERVHELMDKLDRDMAAAQEEPTGEPEQVSAHLEVKNHCLVYWHERR